MEQASFSELAERFHPLLYKTGRSFTDSEADFQDLYQEMLVQLWQSLPRFRQQSALSTFVYRVVLNTAMTYRRQQRRQPPQEGLPAAGLALEEVPDGTQQNIDLLYQAIHALPPTDRSLMLLYLEEKKYQEMAEILGLTPSHVGVKITRIKKRLQTELTKLGYVAGG